MSEFNESISDAIGVEDTREDNLLDSVLDDLEHVIEPRFRLDDLDGERSNHGGFYSEVGFSLSDSEGSSVFGGVEFVVDVEDQVDVEDSSEFTGVLVSSGSSLNSPEGSAVDIGASELLSFVDLGVETAILQTFKIGLHSLQLQQFHFRSRVASTDTGILFDLSDNRESLVLFVKTVHTSSDVVEGLLTGPSIIFVFSLVLLRNILSKVHLVVLDNRSQLTVLGTEGIGGTVNSLPLSTHVVVGIQLVSPFVLDVLDGRELLHQIYQTH